jgi:hypothetical protein
MVTCSPREVIVPAGQEVPITFLFDGIEKAGFYREELEMTSAENGMREVSSQWYLLRHTGKHDGSASSE